MSTNPTATPARDTGLSLAGVTKRFGAVQALTDVDLRVAPGEVVALVGDNGAGKSTLVKIICGVYQPDGGEIVLDGSPVHVRGPREAQDLGISTVFQDLALCDNLDVVGNLFLGQERRSRGVLDEIAMETESWRLLRSLSAKIPSVRIPVAGLSGGQRQIVVLRLGRNAAEFRVEEATTEELVAAITGASDNVVAQRMGRKETGSDV
jgi:D-xylose transport system ATP-binding protein